MNEIDISVVMSVYNGAHNLEKTLNSVLSQESVSFEFIVVNDGSSDNSLEILTNAAKADSRLKVIDQKNTGLTQALITACSQANGTYIARQDCGDISLKNRLSVQLNAISKTPQASMISCGTRFVSPDQDELYTISQSAHSALNGLKTNKIEDLTGPPHHGSVLFSRRTYEDVGGYRKEFLVAQDIDLWTRLIERGDHITLESVYYEAVIEHNSISVNKRGFQLTMAQFIIDCIAERKASGKDVNCLKHIRSYNDTHSNSRPRKPSPESNYHYFIGSNLINTNPTAARRYLKLALRSNPLHWKAMMKLIKLSVLSQWSK